MSQCNMILNHIISHGSITSMEAFELYGITRLSGRIFDLRERGHKIIGVKETGRNRYGQKVQYDRYMMETE